MSRSQAGVPDQVRDRLWERGLERSGKEMQIFLYGQGEFAGGFDRFDHTPFSGDPLSCDVERRSVVDGGTEEF